MYINSGAEWKARGMIDCFESSVIQSYLLGTLDEVQAGLVANHLEHCDQCRAVAATLESVGDAVLDGLRMSVAESPYINEPEYLRALQRVGKLFEGDPIGLMPPGTAGSSAEAISTQVGHYRILPKRTPAGPVDFSPRTDPAGFAQPDRVRVDDCVHAVIDREFARMGAEGTEAWTKPVGRTMDRQPVSLERNQRLARFGDRWDSWEETLSLLVEQTPNQLRDDVPNSYDALFPRAGG